MAIHVFTFVRGRAGQHWQPWRPRRRQASRRPSSSSSSTPSEADPDTHSATIYPEPQGRLNLMNDTRRAFHAEHQEAGMPRGVEPFDPGVGSQTYEMVEWVSLRVGSDEGRWWVAAGVVWFSLWLLVLVWVLRH